MAKELLRGLMYRVRGRREERERREKDRRSARNQAGLAALAEVAPAFRVPEARGFTRVDGLDPKLVGEAVADTQRRIAEIRAQDRQLNRKPYFIQFTELADYGAGDAAFRIATDPAVVRSVADYLGSFPLLYNISAIFSPSSEESGSDGWKGSQLFHRDGEDRRLLKLWILCSDVTEQHGPTMVLPAARSQPIADRLRYSQGPKLPDDEFRDEWDALEAAVGPTGTVYATDTARCFHFGSRTTEECSRLVLMVHYTTEHSYYFGQAANVRRNGEGLGVDASVLSGNTRSLLAIS